MAAKPDITKVDGGWLTADRQVPVDADDIAHGVQRDQYGCAVVRAIQKKFPEATRVRVNARLIGFTIGEVRYTYPTPPEAVEGIIKPFDQGRKEEAEPMTLRLRGGKMRDVVHADDKTLARQRDHARERAAEIKTGHDSDRQRQMSPNWHEYERF